MARVWITAYEEFKSISPTDGPRSQGSGGVKVSPLSTVENYRPGHLILVFLRMGFTKSTY